MQDTTQVNHDKILKSKGQFLTNVFNFDSIKGSTDYQPISLYEQSQLLRSLRLSSESVNSCVIQLSYMCYVSHWYRITLQDITVSIDKRQFQMNSDVINLYIMYRICSKSYNNHMVQIIRKVYKDIRDAIRKFQNSVEQSFSIFFNQFERIISMNIPPANPRNFMLSLEETELFRKHSMLLKTKNCSILNYVQVEGKQKKLQETRERIREDIDSLNEILRHSSQTVPRAKQLQENIENNTFNFFSSLGLEVNRLPVGPNEDHQLRMEIKYAEKDYNFEANVSNLLGAKIPSGQRVDLKFIKQQFIIDYCCQKSSICVKYVTQLQLNVQNSDLLMYQFNNMSFESSNVSLQLYQKIFPQTNNMKSRYLAFKATSWFAKKEPPIEKILLLMDVTMVTAKILEPEVIKPVNNNRDYLKPTELHKKALHYMSILNFVAKKVYFREQQDKNNQ